MVLKLESLTYLNSTIKQAQLAASSKAQSEALLKSEKNELATDVVDLSVSSNEKKTFPSDVVEKIETQVSDYQLYSKVLDDDLKKITQAKESFEKVEGHFDNLKAVAIEFDNLASDVDKNIDKLPKRTKDMISSSLGQIIDSNALGIAVSDARNYKLSDVRVGGESYVPNYSFDISTAAGGSAALSVLERAIVKITEARQAVQRSIDQLMQYPEILELDRMAYQGEQSKIRSVNTAQILVNKLKASVRLEINEVQNSQKIQRISDVISLLTE